MKLFSYWRSSSSWRVRIALDFKGIAYDYEGVHLVENGGEHHAPSYRSRNPMEQLPTLELPASKPSENAQPRYLGQSMAILEYLEETHPRPALLPADVFLRARARQLAEIVNSGIHPLQNLHLMQRLKASFEVDGAPVDARKWCAPFIADGLKAYETLSAETAGKFSVGDDLSFADLCLIPQLYNARRFDVDLRAHQLLLRIEQNCLALDAFKSSHPDAQPDAVVAR